MCHTHIILYLVIFLFTHTLPPCYSLVQAHPTTLLFFSLYMPCDSFDLGLPSDKSLLLSSSNHTHTRTMFQEVKNHRMTKKSYLLFVATMLEVQDGYRRKYVPSAQISFNLGGCWFDMGGYCWSNNLLQHNVTLQQ